jgi:hypothetical protein
MTAVATPSFTDISTQLAKAVDDIYAKKVALDRAIEVVQKANNEYDKAVNDAKELKNQMQNILDAVFTPKNTERVR